LVGWLTGRWATDKIPFDLVGRRSLFPRHCSRFAGVVVCATSPTESLVATPDQDFGTYTLAFDD
jgi:hypothetical protein